MGPEKSRALITFHAFTGCDQTSSFASKGKKTAWETWRIHREATEAFARLSDSPSLPVVNELMPVIERFVTLMYDRTSACTSANEARKDLFKGRTINYAISPTADALIKHLKRSVYQGGLIRGRSLEPMFEPPCPSEWG
jgi:hypothetical protein